MKALFAFISILGMSLPGTATFAATCNEPVAAPTYQVGERFTWQYGHSESPSTERVWEVTGFEGDLAQVKWSDAGMESSDNEGTYLLDRDWVIRGGVNKKGDAVASLTTWQRIGAFALLGKKVLDFPLQVGKAWNVTYVNINSYGYIRTFNLELKVVGCEAVEVPAGKFSALRIEGLRSNEYGHGVQYYWYSPEAKNIVKSEYGDYSPANWFKTRPVGYELIKLELK